MLACQMIRQVELVVLMTLIVVIFVIVKRKRPNHSTYFMRPF